jgi:hypothetical protein
MRQGFKPLSDFRLGARTFGSAPELSARRQNFRLGARTFGSARELSARREHFRSLVIVNYPQIPKR